MLRFNGYPAADLLGEADPRVMSSAQAMAKVGEIAAQVLPNGMGFDWSDLSYEEATQGKAALVVFPLAILLAFLVLAALYESWTLPLAVILIVPMCMLSALLGVKLTGGDNNTFVQVGLVVLMGLACKNAILIVEFARELEIQGKGIIEAALEACRLRLRPIVMTSVAFIAGTVPLVLSHGAGAEVRSVTGITVFAGMLGVTLFGLFLTPVFYVALRKLVTRRRPVVQRRAAPWRSPMPEFRTLRALSLAVVTALVAACAVGPDYVRPDVPVPAVSPATPLLTDGDVAAAEVVATPDPDAEFWAGFDDPVLTATGRRGAARQPRPAHRAGPLRRRECAAARGRLRPLSDGHRQRHRERQPRERRPAVRRRARGPRQRQLLRLDRRRLGAGPLRPDPPRRRGAARRHARERA